MSLSKCIISVNLRYTLENELRDCRLDKFPSVDEYGSKFKTLIKSLAGQRQIIDNKGQVILFLSNLGSSYPLWVTAKRSAARKEVPELDELISELIDEARVEGRNENLALVGKSKGKDKDKKDKKGKKDKKTDAGKGKGKDGQCTHCE